MLSSSPNNRKIRNFLITINQDLFLIREKIEEISYTQIIGYHDYDELHYLVMALEDRRFLKHCGVDFRSILRECIKFFLRKKFGGASTIDMQMVRTITG
ncbi:MAG: transglycosylase domain-containing protein, partial [Neisseria sp.]|nr:transglycosylase domain-containing protein [Neisseria sp.]